jgi:tetratricopeptide (TPR) repeat protein
MLLQSLHKKESASFDKLREIAPGFAFEADLWLSQGHTIQMKGPGEYPAALKCYEMAYDCMLRQNLVPQSKMLLNMGILYHSLGNLKSANDFVRRSLAPTLMHSVEASARSPVFHRPENDIFYHWETSLLTVRVEECPESSGLDNTFNVPLSQLCMVTLSGESSSESFPDSLRVGDDLLVSDVVLEILQVNPSQLICKGFFSALDRYQSHSHGIRIKKSDGNFNHSNLTNCFTLARIQEDRGHLQAAREIYSELLKLRPTFIECLPSPSS